MDAEKVAQLVHDAKYLHDHGAFGPLAQAEFFKAVSAEVAPPPAPLTETADGVTASAS